MTLLVGWGSNVCGWLLARIVPAALRNGVILSTVRSCQGHIDWTVEVRIMIKYRTVYLSRK